MARLSLFFSLMKKIKLVRAAWLKMGYLRNFLSMPSMPYIISQVRRLARFSLKRALKWQAHAKFISMYFQKEGMLLILTKRLIAFLSLLKLLWAYNLLSRAISLGLILLYLPLAPFTADMPIMSFPIKSLF